MQIRPDEMEEYFSFLKKSGRHLDDKTKAIISVITKVDKQTASGFRQYLKRALAHGVTANELIDALFVAFPTLGLSKIVWAVDILLEMDIPDFELSNMQTDMTWRYVMAENELQNGVCLTITCDGRSLLVYKDGKTVRVYDNRCPHQATAISELDQQGSEITCPLHKWKFNLMTGKCTDVGNKPLMTYESKMENGLLMVLW